MFVLQLSNIIRNRNSGSEVSSRFLAMAVSVAEDGWLRTQSLSNIVKFRTYEEQEAPQLED
ncbi:unnamed protein product [Rhodiola kirilowii]